MLQRMNRANEAVVQLNTDVEEAEGIIQRSNEVSTRRDLQQSEVDDSRKARRKVDLFINFLNTF